MGVQSRKVKAHWNYFLAIERDLEVLSRYVDFDERNFKCFSIEIAKILLSAAAEVDVVCKQICKNLKRSSKANNIDKYRAEMGTKLPAIAGFGVQLPRFGLTLHPWDEWKKKNGVPHWWTAYNKIKHNRHSDYHQANLKNALNATAGLLVVVLYLYPEKAGLGELVPLPQLLRPDEAHFGGLTHGGYEFGINYRL